MTIANSYKTPQIVGIGGALRRGSSTEKALEYALSIASDLGADTTIISGGDLELPPFAPDMRDRTEEAVRLVSSLRDADGVILATPAYHGGMSGLLKNVLDYTEDLRTDKRTYLSGRPVGCIVTAGGPQAAVTTLAALRSIVHALRAWPTPLGVTIHSPTPAFDDDNNCLDSQIHNSISTMVGEVLWLAGQQKREPAPWQGRDTD